MKFNGSISSSFANNSKVWDATDCKTDFCFKDDYINQKSTPTKIRFWNFQNKVAETATTTLSRPANYAVTKDSTKAELFHGATNSKQRCGKEVNFNNFIDQAFEITFNVTMTNYDLLSKYSDLQIEFINLLEKIAQMKLNTFERLGVWKMLLKEPRTTKIMKWVLLMPI